MKKYLLFITIILTVACSNKHKHKLTVNLCQYKPNGCTCNLYIEVYQKFGMGALGSDLNTEYLTDSLNFRAYVGTYDDENELISIKCKADSIYIVKTTTTSSNPDWDKPKILEKKVISLKALIKAHHFE